MTGPSAGPRHHKRVPVFSTPNALRARSWAARSAGGSNSLSLAKPTNTVVSPIGQWSETSGRFPGTPLPLCQPSVRWQRGRTGRPNARSRRSKTEGGGEIGAQPECQRDPSKICVFCDANSGSRDVHRRRLAIRSIGRRDALSGYLRDVGASVERAARVLAHHIQPFGGIVVAECQVEFGQQAGGFLSLGSAAPRGISRGELGLTGEVRQLL